MLCAVQSMSAGVIKINASGKSLIVPLRYRALDWKMLFKTFQQSKQNKFLEKKDCFEIGSVWWQLTSQAHRSLTVPARGVVAPLGALPVPCTSAQLSLGGHALTLQHDGSLFMHKTQHGGTGRVCSSHPQMWCCDLLTGNHVRTFNYLQKS